MLETLGHHSLGIELDADCFRLAQKSIPRLAALYPDFTGSELEMETSYGPAPGEDEQQWDWIWRRPQPCFRPMNGLERRIAPCYDSGMSRTLANILEAVRTLSDEERRELATALGNGSSSASPAEHEFEASLAEEGWLSLPQPCPTHRPPPALAPPLVARGRSCSEILIEERR